MKQMLFGALLGALMFNSNVNAGELDLEGADLMLTQLELEEAYGVETLHKGHGKGKKVKRHPRHRRIRACRRAKFTKDQRVAIRKLRKGLRAKQKPLRKALRKSRVALRKTLLDKATKKADVGSKVKRVNNVQSKLRANRMGFLSEVLLNVLSVEQRRPALRCFTKRAKLAKHKRKHHKKRRPGMGKGKGRHGHV